MDPRLEAFYVTKLFRARMKDLRVGLMKSAAYSNYVVPSLLAYVQPISDKDLHDPDRKWPVYRNGDGSYYRLDYFDPCNPQGDVDQKTRDRWGYLKLPASERKRHAAYGAALFGPDLFETEARA